MCYAILRVRYKAVNEQPALIAVEKEEEFKGKLDEVCLRPEVAKVTWFMPHGCRELVSRWEETTYMKENNNEASN